MLLLASRITALEQSAAHPSALIQPIHSDELRELRNEIEALKRKDTAKETASIVEDMLSFATELDELKNTVLKLQTYTMEVNRMLIEERVLSRKSEECQEKEAISMSVFPLPVQHTPTMSALSDGIVIEE